MRALRAFVLRLSLVGTAAGLLAPVRTASAIPYFARKYDVTCGTCHVSVPRLNQFGIAFLERGYQMAETWPRAQRRTIPLAVWASGRWDSRPRTPAPDYVNAYFNRIELISGGKVVVPWLSYFIEWRAISQERRGDGTVRDRSGRFEDIFVTAAARSFDLTVGQFRAVSQVDVSRRLGINEPASLSTGLAGPPGGTGREASLRSFSPSGRSPGVRLGISSSFANGMRWMTAATIPFSGELSIPINDSARIEASNELELRRKGFFGESYVRSGNITVGAHGFYDHSDRYLVNGVSTLQTGNVFWTGVAGFDKLVDATRGRWSLETEFIPHLNLGIGGRVEDRASDGAPVAFLPFINFNFPSTRYIIRLTAERRVQGDRGATFFEFGTVF
ncbi:MAG TPA: hypothetical protein VNO75_08090 [Gemmatimonadaceae bacterium]|nr:hypothetical protein [Gemmatimonadaceae bacterium]